MSVCMCFIMGKIRGILSGLKCLLEQVTCTILSMVRSNLLMYFIIKASM